MVLGKNYRLYKKYDNDNQTYSILFSHRTEKQESLLFEGKAVVVLSVQETEKIKPLYETLKDVYGCIGCLQIYQEDSVLSYLLCITACTSVGKLGNTEIFKINEVDFVSLKNSPGDLDKIQELYRLFKSGSFYFSWSQNGNPLDLTITLQRQSRTVETDNRFFWNKMLYLYFLRYGIDTNKWLTKIMAGSIVINTVYAGQHQVRACLISRLSSNRVGTRFNVRGVNDDGHVANFVETEQCIFLDDKETKFSSYIILRGSVPLFWDQPGINVGSHKIRLSRGSELTQPAYDKHLTNLKKFYGKQTIINLLGSKEGEAMLSKMYKEHHQVSAYSKNVSFVSFDYHTQCPRGKQDNLRKKLLYDINKQINEFGFFVSKGFNTISNKTGELTPESFQIGTFRVNCVDCLDRTNCVQTFIGLLILLKQVSALGIDEKPQVIERLEEAYRSLWIKNGDQLSRIYAGTGALEGKSKLKDSTLSVARTIQNNWWDTSKQEAFEMLLFPKYVSNDLYEKAKSYFPRHYLSLPKNVLTSLIDRYLDYTEPQTIFLTIGTWNINGGKHFSNKQFKKNYPLSDWLLDCNKKKEFTKEPLNIMDLSCNEMQSPGSDSSENSTCLGNENPDIFVIGLEEIVDLNASNIVSASTTNQREFLIEFQKAISREVSYVLVTSTQLVGVCLYVFVRPNMASNIRDVQIDQVKTGLGGTAGNKGGVAIRMTFYNSALCFICSHFAAGQSHVEERNADFVEINRKISFGASRYLNYHDYVFWCGDFNYRIDLSNEEVRNLIEINDLDTLLENDQLIKSQNEGKIFQKFLEGKIKFKPTYKFDVHSNVYDTSEKARIPAWTDRILFKKCYPTNYNEKLNNTLNYGSIDFYDRAELRTSDHRPVVACVNCEILKVNKEKLQKVFEEVINTVGPLDASLIIKHEDGNAGFDNEMLSEIFKILVQAGGKIALARFCSEFLVIIFENCSDALKAFHSNELKNYNLKLSMHLRSENWLDLINKEFNLLKSSTIPLCISNEFNIDNESTDFFSKSIGPACDPSSFCLDDDLEYELPAKEDISPDFIENVLEKSLLISKVPNRPPPPIRLSVVTNNNNKTKNLPMPLVPPLPPPSLINVNKLVVSNNMSAKTIPMRPAPPPPMSISQNSATYINVQASNLIKNNDLLNNVTDYESNSCESELESSFDMPPPFLPPPPVPISDDEENDFLPPLPPPRIDSFEDDFSSKYLHIPPPPPPEELYNDFDSNLDQNEEVLSPWQTLPPAPPIPPVDDKSIPPPIPDRPRFLVEQNNSPNIASSTTVVPTPQNNLPFMSSKSLLTSPDKDDLTRNVKNENISSLPPQIPARRQPPPHNKTLL